MKRKGKVTVKSFIFHEDHPRYKTLEDAKAAARAFDRYRFKHGLKAALLHFKRR